MTKSYVFHLPLDSKRTIEEFGLKKILANNRTTIYQNEKMRFSFDQKVVRILLFDEDEDIAKKLYNFFYGE